MHAAHACVCHLLESPGAKQSQNGFVFQIGLCLVFVNCRFMSLFQLTLLHDCLHLEKNALLGR